MANEETPLPSQRPYLLRAMREWITDCGRTPYIAVDAAQPGVSVPQAYVEDGKIILNISDAATDGLNVGADWLMFRARFAGQATEIVIPIGAVLSIYARETGEGMVFAAEDAPSLPEPPPPPPSGGEANAKRARLKVVK